MDKEKEIKAILDQVDAITEEFKKNPDVIRKSRQIMAYGEFKEVFAYELKDRSEYEQAIAFSFYVCLCTSKTVINRIREANEKGDLNKSTRLLRQSNNPFKK